MKKLKKIFLIILIVIIVLTGIVFATKDIPIIKEIKNAVVIGMPEPMAKVFNVVTFNTNTDESLIREIANYKFLYEMNKPNNTGNPDIINGSCKYEIKGIVVYEISDTTTFKEMMIQVTNAKIQLNHWTEKDKEKILELLEDETAMNKVEEELQNRRNEIKAEGEGKANPNPDYERQQAEEQEEIRRLEEEMRKMQGN